MLVTALGRTRDPVALVPGSVGSAREAAADWRRKAVECGRVADALARVNLEDAWTGTAADAFREKYKSVPAKWSDASTQLGAAANALDIFADYLEWAQTQAGEAIALWDQAAAATAAAKTQHAARVEAARSEFAKTYRLPGAAATYSPQIPFVDPGATLRAEATAVLSDARGQLEAAGERCAATLDAAADAAPGGPDTWAVTGAVLGAVWDLQARQAQNTFASMVNAVASFGNALVQHPDILWEILGGLGLIALGTGGEAGGVVLDATGIGAVAGVPLNVVAAGAIGAGATAVGHGIFRAVAAGSGDSAVEPVGKREGVDRGDGRDDLGHYASGNGGDRIASQKEAAGLDRVAEQNNVEVIRTKVKARVEGAENGRYYDGLIKNPDGTYTGVEIKSGSVRYPEPQRNFDNLVIGGTPAEATLNGERIQIVDVIVETVP